VEPRLSVSAAHNIAERVRLTILNDLPSVSEVLVHVDAEHDHPFEEHSGNKIASKSTHDAENGTTLVSTTLPEKLMLSQSQIENDVKRVVQEVNRSIEGGSVIRGVSDITCHYLNDQLHVELCVEVDPDVLVRDAQLIARRVRRDLEALRHIDHAHLNLRLDDRYPCERL